MSIHVNYMDVRKIEPLDVIGAGIAAVVFGYFLIIEGNLVRGFVLAAWILSMSVSLRNSNYEHTVVLLVLGSLITGAMISGQFTYLLLSVVVAGFGYTLWTIKRSSRDTAAL
ncbi:hypothetical protein GOC74_04295 [Halomicrobium mukohataei]|uniref:Uncharacterized protein n=1 Tax=Halomicrobium mukohataei TaxID=57705 RepID=A0A847UDK0_9EURY|nr:hypothetical protein [Halomicrobium mukohataei]NLV09148.1 hypothetical protein [Halomicrobium mukohataei]